MADREVHGAFVPHDEHRDPLPGEGPTIHDELCLCGHEADEHSVLLSQCNDCDDCPGFRCVKCNP